MKKEKKEKDIAVDLFKAIDQLLRLPQNAYPRGERDGEITVQKDVVYDSALPGVCLLDLYFPPDFAGTKPATAGKGPGAGDTATAGKGPGIGDTAAAGKGPGIGDTAAAGKGPGAGVRTSTPKKTALLYIHGGGFVAGGKEYREGIARWYAGYGLTVVNVDYGLCPDYQYPEPLRHLVRALDFVGENAEALGIDPGKIIISGDSAGAYYAAMLAAAAGSDEFSDKLGARPKARVAAAIFDCGLYDIELTINTKFLLNVDEQIFQRFTGLSEKNFHNFHYRELCSPVNYITPDFPPSFVQYAQKDIFCKGQGERLVAKLDEQRVPYRAFYSGSLLANHCFPLNWKDPTAKRANAALLAFVDDFVSGGIEKPDYITTDLGDAMPESF